MTKTQAQTILDEFNRAVGAVDSTVYGILPTGEKFQATVPRGGSTSTAELPKLARVNGATKYAKTGKVGKMTIRKDRHKELFGASAASVVRAAVHSPEIIAAMAEPEPEPEAQPEAQPEAK